MNSVRYHAILIILLVCLTVSCAGKSEPDEIILSGTIEGQALTDHPDKPVLVAVMRNDETAPVGTYSLDRIVAMVSADKQSLSFRLDLTESGLTVGDEINLVAFVDLNYSQGLPNPDSGDNVGIYIDQQTYSTAYALKSGINSGFNIKVNRMMRPFTTEIGGTVKGDAVGDMLIVVYAGEIDTLDFSNLDPDCVIGYSRQHKGASELKYSLELLPYPAEVQTDSVFIVALLDDQGAGMPAPGNIVGFHTDPTGSTPLFFPLSAERDTQLSGMDIQMRFPDASGRRTAEIRIPEPSGDHIILNGHFTLPDDFDPDQGALFALIAQVDNPADIITSPLTSVKYFHKMPRGVSDFSLDLSDTGLSLDDEVMVIAIWDKDYRFGFPNPTPNDVIGYLQNKEQMSYSIVLSQWQDLAVMPEGWNFSLNKIYHDRQAAVRFQIYAGDEMISPAPGDVVVAVAIARQGVNFMSASLDMDFVVGIGKFIVGSDGPPYTLNILPLINKDIEVSESPFLQDICIMALLDNPPANGKPDTGENIGFYATLSPLGLKTFDIQDGTQILDGGVAFFTDFIY